MAKKVIMSKQGLQMTEGTIIKWLKKEGEKIEVDEPLFEMETDKLNIEITSTASGTLLKILRGEGEVVPITETIAVIGEPGEDISDVIKECECEYKSEYKSEHEREYQSDYNSERNNGKQKETDGSEGQAEVALHKEDGKFGVVSEEIGDGQVENPDEDKRKKTADNEEHMETALNQEDGKPGGPVPAGSSASGRFFSTPRARMAADSENLDISEIPGTGPEGLIIERDVKSYIANKSARQKAALLAKKLAQQNDVMNARGERIIPFSGMRKAIAGNMMKSLQGMAQANHRMKVDMTEIIRMREKFKAGGLKVSFTDIIVKTVSKALLDFPILNSSLADEGIVLKNYVNMGIAVALYEGLIVPVIKNADIMTIQEISTVASELIEKAKTGKLKPDECRGGTFTVTNLGMFDIDEFTAIINPPESAILAVGKIDRVPVVEGEGESGNIIVKPIMVLSLTYDHRIIDGAPAAQFLQRVKQLMQNPYQLI
ncbi:MAG: dihydrolipoamide acetyltransferase family protein [Clostridiales bacterium]|nr:dihydrolipoamide acetyltransferase family protein [Clostridiales bacterium]